MIEEIVRFREKEKLKVKRSRLQKSFISAGIICYFSCIFLLLNTVFLQTDSIEYFLFTLSSGILFGFAIFFEGYGYYILAEKYEGRLSYFGSPLLFQLMRIIYGIPYVLLCYNAFMIVGNVNIELIVLYVIFYLPYVLSRVSWRWTWLRNWLKNLDQRI